MDNISKTLTERGENYGNNWDAYVKLKEACKGAGLNNLQEYAIDMILMKISRIVAGDAGHIDSWHDIAGYATLVEQKMTKSNGRMLTPEEIDAFVARR